MITSMLNILQLKKNFPNFAVTRFTIHRLLLASVLISTKYNDDKYVCNSFFAKAGGISTEELNRLEIELLFLIDFRLYLDREDYKKIHACT